MALACRADLTDLAEASETLCWESTDARDARAAERDDEADARATEREADSEEKWLTLFCDTDALAADSEEECAFCA